MTAETLMTLEEDTLMTDLYNALANRRCICKRKYLYSGPVIDTCHRCLVMIRFELYRTEGKESKTKLICEAIFT